MFVQHAYLTTAHNYGDHDDADTLSRDFNSLTTTSTEGEDYGKIVKGLLTSGDFSFGTLHQWLDYTCRNETLLHFCFFDDGYGLAVTSTTHKYADLNYYLLCFLHHHGVPPGFSSIKVESNERGQLKSDPLQAEKTFVHMLNVRNDEDAKCWIQYHGATPGHYCVYRQVGQLSY